MIEIPDSCESCAFWMPFGDTCHPKNGVFHYKDKKCEHYQLSKSYGEIDKQLDLFDKVKEHLGKI